MLVPRKNDFNIWEEMFDEPFFNRNSKLMSTDIKESKDNYNIIIDLPGYNKEDIKIDIDNGYLTVNAKVSKTEEENEKNRFVRRERYYGECSRTYYVGDNITAEDIEASFKNGTLNLIVPKKEQKELPEKKYIEIKD